MNENNTKAKILEAMYALVAEKGYDKASIGQIADEIGIKKASVYYYFKSKEDIFLQLISQLYKKNELDDTNLFLGKPSQKEYCEKLIALGEEFISSYFANKDLRKIYAEIDIQTARIPALKEFVKADNANVIAFINKCLERGIALEAFPKSFDVSLHAQVLYAVLVGIDQAILYDMPIEPKAVWKEVILNLFENRGILQP